MKNLITVFLIALISFSTFAGEGRNVSVYNLNAQGTGFVNGSVENNPNAPGFDPVSAFPEAGGSALEGEDRFSLEHEGVEYLFTNEANMKTFLTNPDKYEPTYGGWCARAMVVGQQVQINTKYSTVVGNRSFFFVNKRAKRFFDRDVEGNAKLADQEWLKISGEQPRL